MLAASSVEVPKGRILVVEDEPVLGRLFEVFLNRAGYRAEVAVSGIAALERLEVASPDLVVLDWALPDISGVEVCTKITSPRRRSSTIPVILISGHNDDLHRRQSVEAGASEFLGKPFAWDALVSCITFLIDVTRSRALGSMPGAPQGINSVGRM